MATGSRIYTGSNLPLFYLSGSSPSFLVPGSSSMVSFVDVNNNKSSKNKRSFFQSYEQEVNNGDDQGYDEYFYQSGKKRRLTLDQLNFLEKSFGMENKLEPDRKLQLANDLGLQPRQVAIWFQNRRARWKTKEMEKDYDLLQDSFNALKSKYDSLVQEKEDLKSQVALLSEELALKQRGKDMLDAVYIMPCQTQQQNTAAASISDSEESKVSAMASKQDEYSTSPAKLDNGIFDSDSTSHKRDDMFETDSQYYIECGTSTNMHLPHFEHLESSYIPEPENSDLAREEDDRGCFLPSTPYRLCPKMELGDYSTSGNFMYPAFWSWSL